MRLGLFHCYACGASLNAKQLAVKTRGEAVMLPTVSGKLRQFKEDWSWMISLSLALGNDYLKSRNVNDDDVKRFGIIDTVVGVAFPMHNALGEVTGFIERRHEMAPRYMFHGKRQPAWRLHEIRRLGRRPFIVEGVFGVINALHYGVEAITPMGCTNVVNMQEVLNGRRPTIAFDDDFAGYLAAAKGIIKLGVPALVPGIEADEISLSEWRNLDSWHEVTHRVSRLEELSGDEEKFKVEIDKFVRRKGAYARRH
jgi:DNA primase